MLSSDIVVVSSAHSAVFAETSNRSFAAMGNKI